MGIVTYKPPKQEGNAWKFIVGIGLVSAGVGVYDGYFRNLSEQLVGFSDEYTCFKADLINLCTNRPVRGDIISVTAPDADLVDGVETKTLTVRNKIFEETKIIGFFPYSIRPQQRFMAKPDHPSPCDQFKSIGYGTVTIRRKTNP